mgnify:CR=1 FL=1
MKSRELKTTPEVIVTNYTFKLLPSGETLHRFTPQNTETVYQFFDSDEPRLKVGKAYSLGYLTVHGINWVDVTTIAPADKVNPYLSHRAARHLGELIREVETRKSNERVKQSATNGHYLGCKYAWRIYGMSVSDEAFSAYLDGIGHPSVSCTTLGTPSIAYKEEGLEAAIDALIDSCIRIRGNRFRSPLLPSKKHFKVKGIDAITDKK